MAGKIVECPKCKCQLMPTINADGTVKLSFMSCPKRATVSGQVGVGSGGGGSYGSVDTSDLEELLEQAELRASALDDKEEEFVGSVRVRFDRFGERTYMTEAQMAWLRRIAEGK